MREAVKFYTFFFRRNCEMLYEFIQVLSALKQRETGK
jgi:hypothetical protein